MPSKALPPKDGAARCGLATPQVELITADARPCLVVERYDRDTTATPTDRRHQEDLCQALGGVRLAPIYDVLSSTPT